ncbi:hypothetical protein GCM10009850_087940 [Nonomuraea monospora]|uniref:Uncharacterized protein n=1 Tax=Nonomuraea monospora TaxID=568818 RepID=A0ABP5PNP8_9ACTN
MQVKWKPYMPSPDVSVWVQESSCCGAYTLLHEGREGVVTRWSRDGNRMETGRGPHLKALLVWNHLVGCHRHYRHEKRKRRVAS